ncbi:uncharacterized protein [Amphiura filiformis]|uniref:uncharacterized protein n=1 Tax=Amphiura filiformis TaxID=82378 RepID=UPI003B226E3D
MDLRAQINMGSLCFCYGHGGIGEVSALHYWTMTKEDQDKGKMKALGIKDEDDNSSTDSQDHNQNSKVNQHVQHPDTTDDDGLGEMIVTDVDEDHALNLRGKLRLNITEDEHLWSIQEEDESTIDLDQDHHLGQDQVDRKLGQKCNLDQDQLDHSVASDHNVLDLNDLIQDDTQNQDLYQNNLDKDRNHGNNLNQDNTNLDHVPNMDREYNLKQENNLNQDHDNLDQDHSVNHDHVNMDQDCLNLAENHHLKSQDNQPQQNPNLISEDDQLRQYMTKNGQMPLQLDKAMQVDLYQDLNFKSQNDQRQTDGQLKPAQVDIETQVDLEQDRYQQDDQLLQNITANGQLMSSQRDKETQADQAHVDKQSQVGLLGQDQYLNPQVVQLQQNTTENGQLMPTQVDKTMQVDLDQDFNLKLFEEQLQQNTTENGQLMPTQVDKLTQVDLDRDHYMKKSYNDQEVEADVDQNHNLNPQEDQLQRNMTQNEPFKEFKSTLQVELNQTHNVNPLELQQKLAKEEQLIPTHRNNETESDLDQVHNVNPQEDELQQKLAEEEQLMPTHRNNETESDLGQVHNLNSQEGLQQQSTEEEEQSGLPQQDNESVLNSNQDHSVNSRDNHLQPNTSEFEQSKSTTRDDDALVDSIQDHNNLKLQQEHLPLEQTKDDKLIPIQESDDALRDSDQTDSNQRPSDADKKPCSEFGVDGTEDGDFTLAKSLAVSSDGDIVVAEHGLERVYLFDQDFVHKSSMKSDKTRREAKILYPTDVAFTSPIQIGVVDQTRFVKIFNKEGAFLNSFNIKSDTDGRDERPKAYSIEVASDGRIFVGDIRRKVITIHKELNGKFERVRKVNLNIEPHFLATGDFQNGHHDSNQNGCQSSDHVVACDWKAGQVNGIDLEIEDKADNIIFQIDSFKVDGHPGLPKGVACDRDNHQLFIAVSRLDESGKRRNVYKNTGHIHQYTTTGKFECCIHNGLNHPRGMTWHQGALYIANTNSVAVLRIEKPKLETKIVVKCSVEVSQNWV